MLISTLRCGAGCAYVKRSRSKKGDIWHHTAHFKNYRQITKGKHKGWYEIHIVKSTKLFRSKWRPVFTKVTVPSSAIKYLPRPKRKRTQ